MCGALERHRRVSLFLKDRDELLRRAGRILHIAPERSIEKLLNGHGTEYVSLDLGERDAAIRADLTSMPFRANSFDGIYCRHVLEHVPPDVAAMSEMRRVMRPSGWAIMQVPIKRRTTFEDPSIEDPRVRRRLFGQPDHVREYGYDFVDRLERAGFDVTVEQPHRRMASETVERLGLGTRDDIFFCRNRRAAARKAAA